MFKNHHSLLPLILFSLVANLAWSETANVERGRLLYENHCLNCHVSQVHIRKNHKAHTLEGVFQQVIRWSEEMQLPWQSNEIFDVSQYLYRTFYTDNLIDRGTSMILTTSAFSPNAAIPTQYTCEGSDISPALNWSGVPAGTQSLALIVDDPDAPDPAAPKMTWVHWLLYNLPPDTQGLSQAVPTNALPQGTLQGLNDWKRIGYGGPCPPIGRHRYFFKLYALDSTLPDLNRPTKKELEQAMQGHILEKGELMGTYQK